MEDQAIGQRLTVFLEREIDFELLGESSWDVVAQRCFDQRRQFSANLNTLALIRGGDRECRGRAGANR